MVEDDLHRTSLSGSIGISDVTSKSAIMQTIGVVGYDARVIWPV